MSNTRIKDISTTATTAASDDYVVIDGATKGTRKILTSNVGEKWDDFTSTLTLSPDGRGVAATGCQVQPTVPEALTAANGARIRGYLVSGSTVYPLITTYVVVGTNYFNIQLKSIYYSTQSTTSSSTVSGTLHILAPFKIASVISGM